jgi:hypothetical protein
MHWTLDDLLRNGAFSSLALYLVQGFLNDLHWFSQSGYHKS